MKQYIKLIFRKEKFYHFTHFKISKGCMCVCSGSIYQKNKKLNKSFFFFFAYKVTFLGIITNRRVSEEYVF